MNHERAHVANVRHVGVQLQCVNEVAGLLQGCVLEGEAEHRAGALGQVLLRTLVPGGGFHASPDDLLDLRVCFEPTGDLGGVLDVALDAQGEGFQTDADVEGVGRGDSGAGVTQQGDARLQDVGEVRAECGVLAQVACVDQAVVAGGGLVELGELLGVCTVVEVTGVNDYAADGGAVATQVLGCGVDDHVRAVLDGAQQVGGGHGVVHDQGHAVFVRNCSDGLDVEHVVAGVGYGLAVEELGVGANGGAPLVQVIGVLNEGGFDTEVGEGVLEQVVGAAVHGGGGNNVVACTGNVQDCVGDSCLAGCQQQRANAAFQGSDTVFDDFLGGVVEAGVNGAQLGEGETVRCLLGTFKDERGGLVDR